jgi:glucosyl-3-phosphoglycerate synthase
VNVSVVIPVLNEARTIAPLVQLCLADPGVTEVIVVDDGSIDGTPEVAKRAGAKVITSSLLGKGASMEDGVAAARGDVILFLDGDLTEVCDDLVERMTSAIETGEADLVKARFTRDAGRVTVLTARPLLAAFFPELARFEQPLGGIVAVRRSLLGKLRLENDYGVDVALLIDAYMKGARVVEVDIGWIDHDSQSLEALGAMAKQITRVILDRAWRHDRLSINQVRDMEEAERRAGAELCPPSPRFSDRPARFALFDMDGTLLEGRVMAELAESLGAEAELGHLVDNRRLGPADRTRAIARVLAGVPLDVFQEVARAIPLTDGAVETVRAFRRAGYSVGVVTDSFHAAAEMVRRRVFADFAVAHLLRFRNGMATGEVELSPLMLYGPVCRRHDCCKLNVLHYLADRTGLAFRQTIAVGDGENDVCLLKKAGFSIAFRPKSKEVRRAAMYTVEGSLLDIFDLPGFQRLSPKTRRRRSLVRLAGEGAPTLAEGAS